MLTLSFRDPDNEKRFAKVSDKMLHLYAQKIRFATLTSHKRIVFLIHGYANTQTDVFVAYAQVEEKFNDPETLLVGIDWPSNGTVFGYYSDRKDGADMGEIFAKLLTAIQPDIPMHVMTHSMGGRVMAEALTSPRLHWARINTWIAFNADINRRKLKADKEYGKWWEWVNKAYFYYSKEDRVLGFIAPVALPVVRVGRAGLCESDRPENFYDVDATEIDPELVRHNSYRTSDVLIPHALKLMKGNE